MSWKCYVVLFHINIKYRNIYVYGKTHFEIVYFVTSDKKLKFSLSLRFTNAVFALENSNENKP